jgi:hypothetical protein
MTGGNTNHYTTEDYTSLRKLHFIGHIMMKLRGFKVTKYGVGFYERALKYYSYIMFMQIP